MVVSEKEADQEIDGRVLLAAGLVGVGVSPALFREIVAGFWPTVFAFPLLACSMAMMVAAAGEGRSLIGRYAIPGAGPLATGAYSLYLTYKAVFQAVRSALSQAPAPVQSVGLAVAVLAALAAGAALYWLVERPFLKLRDRFEGPSRSSLASPASTPVVAR